MGYARQSRVNNTFTGGKSGLPMNKVPAENLIQRRGAQAHGKCHRK